MTSKNAFIPFTEKYRPTNFETIVLDPMNRKLFENILEKKHFPNLLFYGPPGTGKTTTVINLINKYQEKYNRGLKGSIIHLNASDDRGIDVVRNHINEFVRTKNMFETGGKYVVLDEVDHMTKTAQQALKYLLQTSMTNVHFCLICNYMSKIDEALRNEFVCVRFTHFMRPPFSLKNADKVGVSNEKRCNKLPINEIHAFIKNICEKENLKLTDANIETVQNIHGTDIRSMVNFLQLNQNTQNWNALLNVQVWNNLFSMMKNQNIKDEEIVNYIHQLSVQNNIDKMNILQTFFNYIIKNHNYMVTVDFLNHVKNIVHYCDVPSDIFVDFFVNGRHAFYTQMMYKKRP